MTRTLLVAETEVPRIGRGTNRLQDTAEHAAFVRDAMRCAIRDIDAARLREGSGAFLGKRQPAWKGE